MMAKFENVSIGIEGKRKLTLRDLVEAIKKGEKGPSLIFSGLGRKERDQVRQFVETLREKLKQDKPK